MRTGTGRGACGRRERQGSTARRGTASGVCAALAVVATVAGPGSSAFAAGSRLAGRDDRSASAWYDGEVIDLRDGWGGARACLTDGTTTTCFATEAALDAHLAAGGGVVDDLAGGSTRRSAAGAPAEVAHVGGGTAGVAPEDTIELDVRLRSACAGTLRLYQHTRYGGTVLAFSTRFTFLNLSAWGFDNATSSYRVGPCSATFYDGANGSGSVYGGFTGAYGASSSMVGGWDNRVSSIYIA